MPTVRRMRRRRALSVIDAVMGAAVFAVAASLTVSLTSVGAAHTSAAIAAAAPLREVTAIDTTLRADIAAAAVCPDDGLGVPVLNIADGDVALAVVVSGAHAAATGGPHDTPVAVVWWRHTAGQMLRAVAPFDDLADCDPGDPPALGDYTVVAGDVAAPPGSDNVIVGVNDGVPVAGQSCSWPDLHPCAVDAVELRVSVGGVGAAAASRTAQYPIAYGASQVRR